MGFYVLKNAVPYKEPRQVPMRKKTIRSVLHRVPDGSIRVGTKGMSVRHKDRVWGGISESTMWGNVKRCIGNFVPQLKIFSPWR